MTLRNWRQQAWEAIFEQAKQAHADKQHFKAEFLYKLALLLHKYSAVDAAEGGKLLLLMGELFLVKRDFKSAEDSFKSAALFYEKNSLGTEVDMAIALREMSLTARFQGKLDQAAQLAYLAQQFTSMTRRRLEKCFRITAG